MAAPPTIRYASAVVIDSTNNVIRADDSGVPFNATITEGTYFFSGNATGTTTDDLVYQVAVALNASGTDTWNTRYNSDGTVGIRADASWSIDWDHANTSFNGLLLGILDVSLSFGDGADTWVDAPFQTMNTWLSTQAVVSDSGVDEEEQGSASVVQTRAKSGQVYTVKQGEYEDRVIVHGYEPAYKAFDTTPASTRNEAWMVFWKTANDGRQVRYYVDASDEYSDEFQGVFDEDTCASARPSRYDPAIALYGWTVRMLGYVA